MKFVRARSTWGCNCGSGPSLPPNRGLYFASKLFLFSDSDCERDAHKVLRYENTIFVGNVTNVDYNYYFRFPPVVKHECIHFCIETKLCDAIFVAYKDNDNNLDWCSFHHVGDNMVNFTSIEPSLEDSSIAPWNSFLTAGYRIPVTSELIILGN